VPKPPAPPDLKHCGAPPVKAFSPPMALFRSSIGAVLLGSLFAQSVVAQRKDTAFSGVTAGMLADMCRNHSSLKLDSCGAYIMGVVDEFATSSRNCRPINTTSGNFQVEAIALKYLRENPERWDRPAMLEVERSLTLAFPCSKR
jgi:hypothetical protein